MCGEMYRMDKLPNQLGYTIIVKEKVVKNTLEKPKKEKKEPPIFYK